MTDGNADEPFDDIEPDPDGVLDAFGIDDPNDLLEDLDAETTAHGDHDPTRDETIDVTDTMASDLFDGLERAAAEIDDGATVTREPPALPGRQLFGFDEGTTLEGGALTAVPDSWQSAFEEGASEATAGETQAGGDTGGVDVTTSVAPSTAGLSLAGPCPEPIRIANDRFGSSW